MEAASMRPIGPEDIQTEMERFFAHLGSWKRPIYFFEKTWTPHCDVSETSDEVVVVADLGGVSPGDIGIKVIGNKMVLSGVRREPANAPRRNYRQMEITYGQFERSIELPRPVDAENAHAVYEDGFLEVRLPKVTGKPGREVEVDVATEQ
jgi:HSP20 family protein